MYRWIMGLASQAGKNERARQRALSDSDLTKDELEFVLKKIKTIDFKGFELDTLISVVNKLQKQWLTFENAKKDNQTSS